MTHLLDTSTCSFALKRRRGVAARMAAVSPADLAVSSITVAEAWTGAAKSQNPIGIRRAWDSFFRALRKLPFDEACAAEYARIRAKLERDGTMIGANDCLIAATALAHKLVVVTTDVDEFSRAPGLVVEDWTSGP